ncbi:hypothetical protein [Methylomonas albis]|nr:hypothetical protein [Methylomonas albis]
MQIGIKNSVGVITGRFWPIQGIQNLTGFEPEPVETLLSERLAVFNSESVAV